ncbi:hypothetical protein [Pendulispora albinea]|uniref:Lipoprotein n=1 Tax=Pendulispora albinea TaxID=2741071 RepID=A0ABZ2LQ67_9BACT
MKRAGLLTTSFALALLSSIYATGCGAEAPITEERAPSATDDAELRVTPSNAATYADPICGPGWVFTVCPCGGASGCRPQSMPPPTYCGC